MIIVSYRLENLPSKEKMKINYRLFGRKGYGSKSIIKKYGGIKLGDGCFIISREGLKAVIGATRKL